MSAQTIFKSIGVLLIILSLLYFGFVFFLFPMFANSNGEGVGLKNLLIVFFELPSSITFFIGCILVLIARYYRKKSD